MKWNPLWSELTTAHHSTPIKRWLNPILRVFGWQIVSVVQFPDWTMADVGQLFGHDKFDMTDWPKFIRYELRRQVRGGSGRMVSG